MTHPTEVRDDYPIHLARVLAAIQGALADAGAEAMVIEAGRQHYIFQDDQPYPYHPSAWYQWLAPAPAAPGSLILLKNNELPELLLVTPDDYWHAPPQLPTAPWTRQFHLVALPDSQAALDRALSLRGKVVWMGESPAPRADWAANPPRLLGQLELQRAIKSDYELACMRQASLIGARGHLAAARAFREGAQRVRHPHGLPRRHRPERDRAALWKHRRAERALRHPALPAARPGRARRCPTRC